MSLLASYRYFIRSHAEGQLYLVFLSACLETIGWSIVTPVLPALHTTLSLSITAIGNISSLVSVIALISVVLQGMASDSYGRSTLLFLSSFAQLVGLLFLALFASSTLTSHSFLWLFVLARVLPSAFKCGMIVAQASVTDWTFYICSSSSSNSKIGTLQQEATKNISQLMAWTNVGFIIGPIIGGQLSSIYPHLPFLVGACVFFVNIVVILFMKDPPASSSSSSSSSSSLPPSSHASFSSVEDGGAGGSSGRWGGGARGGSSYAAEGERGKWLAAASSIHHRAHRRTLLVTPPPWRAQGVNTGTGSSSSSGGGGGGGSGSPKGRGGSFFSEKNSSGSGGGGGGVSGEASKVPSPSLGWLLQLKFFFQIGNAIYESLFAQHLRDRLGIGSSGLGWLLGCIGALAAAVNAFVVRALLAGAAERVWPLMIVTAITQSIGLYLWAKCASFVSASIGAAFIALSSNTFLSIIQGLIASHKDSQNGAGLALGWSTACDRGARTLAPLLGGFALHRYGTFGFAITASASGCYTALQLVAYLARFGQYSPFDVVEVRDD